MIKIRQNKIGFRIKMVRTKTCVVWLSICFDMSTHIVAPGLWLLHEIQLNTIFQQTCILSLTVYSWTNPIPRQSLKCPVLVTALLQKARAPAQFDQVDSRQSNIWNHHWQSSSSRQSRVTKHWLCSSKLLWLSLASNSETHQLSTRGLNTGLMTPQALPCLVVFACVMIVFNFDKPRWCQWCYCTSISIFVTCVWPFHHSIAWVHQLWVVASCALRWWNMHLMMHCNMSVGLFMLDCQWYMQHFEKNQLFKYPWVLDLWYWLITL